jgi:hypothetical protein
MTVASALPGRLVVYRAPRQTTHDHEPVEVGHEIQLEEPASRPSLQRASSERDDAAGVSQREDHESGRLQSQQQIKTDGELASSREAGSHSGNEEDC